jgi:hypothetical protein
MSTISVIRTIGNVTRKFDITPIATKATYNSFDYEISYVISYQGVHILTTPVSTGDSSFPTSVPSNDKLVLRVTLYSMNYYRYYDSVVLIWLDDNKLISQDYSYSSYTNNEITEIDISLLFPTSVETIVGLVDGTVVISPDTLAISTINSGLLSVQSMIDDGLTTIHDEVTSDVSQSLSDLGLDLKSTADEFTINTQTVFTEFESSLNELTSNTKEALENGVATSVGAAYGDLLLKVDDLLDSKQSASSITLWMSMSILIIVLAMAIKLFL